LAQTLYTDLHQKVKEAKDEMAVQEDLSHLDQEEYT